MPQLDHPSFSMLFSPAASSLASTPGGAVETVEMEVHWDPSLVRSELMQATSVLSHRGLKLAAKWASEQLVGIPVGNPHPASLDNNTNHHHNHHHHYQLLQAEFSQLTAKDWYAKSLFDLGEYLHAASVLSESTTDVTRISAPLEDLSSFGIYLRAYALYLAGERRKEEEYLELQRYVL
jgi:anaphase-promoting complex subunit 8